MIIHTLETAAADEKPDSLMISQISDRMGIAPPTVTQLVNGLERKGYVIKKPDPDDGRIVRVALSAKGEKLVEKASDEFYAKFCELADYLGEEKSIRLSALMHEVFDFFAARNKIK